MSDITGFKEGQLLLTHLGVSIIASKLSQTGCRTLLDKIAYKIKTQSSENMSFARRTLLINSILFGLFNYWASIFILPHEVVEQVTYVSRNFLWSGTTDYKGIPHIAWHQNKASITKLVGAVAKNQDTIWVKWVHERYIKAQSWWLVLEEIIQSQGHIQNGQHKPPKLVAVLQKQYSVQSGIPVSKETLENLNGEGSYGLGAPFQVTVSHGFSFSISSLSRPDCRDIPIWWTLYVLSAKIIRRMQIIYFLGANVQGSLEVYFDLVGHEDSSIQLC
ncbi:hypothetical protein Cgig2_019823 [Carnegiea gigantea]|uniref:Uncharacterized protein n=1 Tax=Carnegiea gigantea TaxID=171969 RepID=A0A9Q1JZ00_9CARY|nr:hypothetical protein Cgig2_019823 [Carnegiea gigantea]